MKTLVTGFLIFACWASLSTWIYVCKIKGLCAERETMAISPSEISDGPAADTLSIIPEIISVAPEMLLVFFEFDKSSFAIDSELSAFSDALISYINQNSESGLFITGHTDYIGSAEYNQGLGYRRAQSLKNYFQNKGIPADKISIVSKGKNEPIENNSTDRGRARNRRASISIITNN